MPAAPAFGQQVAAQILKITPYGSLNICVFLMYSWCIILPLAQASHRLYILKGPVDDFFSPAVNLLMHFLERALSEMGRGRERVSERERALPLSLSLSEKALLKSPVDSDFL